MMNNKKLNIKHCISSLSLASLVLLSVSTIEASANHVVSARNVNSIQTKQAKSIEAGVRIGKLTPKEARELRKEQHDIIDIERSMREDGKLNASELGKLFKKLQSAQNHINKLSRNSISSHGTAIKNRISKVVTQGN